MRCNAKPYQDKEPYFFVSYCHKDSHRVFPIIERLARKGFRLWYDEGIQAGSEWPEIIAEHLYSADACVIFLSNEYAQSHNCRKGIKTLSAPDEKRIECPYCKTKYIIGSDYVDKMGMFDFFRGL